MGLDNDTEQAHTQSMTERTYRTETLDADERPYFINKEDAVWVVRDSRGRHVSAHRTLADAKGSV